MHHCHWLQSMWALSQHCHGPLTELPLHKHTYTHTGPYKPLSVPWVFVLLSALVGMAIKGSPPTYLSSPEHPQISLCLTVSPSLFFPLIVFSPSPFVDLFFFCCLFLSLLYLAPHHSPFLYLDCLSACSLLSWLCPTNRLYLYSCMLPCINTSRLLACLVDSVEYPDRNQSSLAA